MPLPPANVDFTSCSICCNSFNSSDRKPVTLMCSHTICSNCLDTIESCPFDSSETKKSLPINEAILCAVTGASSQQRSPIQGLENNEDITHYSTCMDCMIFLATLLRPSPHPFISRPLNRKLTALLQCQLMEPESRIKAMKSIRSIGERVLMELLIKHQNPNSISANLWAAVRSRGCQFLGPAMQEEVLRLVKLALEDGIALSRKVLVMFVVQRLSEHFPHQASKTAIGHVVQILYRGSCFKLMKRDGDSSLMQLKEEYYSYEALRREHDTQIVSIAMESGLRISPDQWSSLLYGDTAHKSHMQSIIDRLQTPNQFSSSIQELMVAAQRTNDPSQLLNLRGQFEYLSRININGTPEEGTDVSLQEMADSLQAVEQIVVKLIQFLEQHGYNVSQHRNSHHQQQQMSQHFTQQLVPSHHQMIPAHPQYLTPVSGHTLIPSPPGALIPSVVPGQHHPHQNPTIRLNHHPHQLQHHQQSRMMAPNNLYNRTTSTQRRGPPPPRIH